jgi:hypothetical protein
MVRPLPLLEVLIANLVLIALFFWITGDYSFRIAYWGTEVFTPATVRYPLFLVTSAVKGSTTMPCIPSSSSCIPGLLTLDWQQVVLLLMAVTDAVYLWSVVRMRRGAAGAPRLAQ